jgi:hypothetical protein
MNWAIVILMLTIGGMFGHLLLTFFDHEPATGDGAPEGYSVEQAEPQHGYSVADGGSLASSQ